VRRSNRDSPQAEDVEREPCVALAPELVNFEKNIYLTALMFELPSYSICGNRFSSGVERNEGRGRGWREEDEYKLRWRRGAGEGG